MARRIQGGEHRPSRTGSGGLTPAVALGLGVVAAGAALGVTALRNRRNNRPPDSAPGRMAKGLARRGAYALAGRTVTINKPRSELYAFWRDFRNLPRFMENIEAVEVQDGGKCSAWTIAAPMGRSVRLETELIEDRENSCIAWRSLPGSDIKAHGRVEFRDAPAGRGSEVEAVVAYEPPAGELGRWIAKAFQREPNVQGRRELKRFKMLMETGEVATSRNRNDRGQT